MQVHRSIVTLASRLVTAGGVVLSVMSTPAFAAGNPAAGQHIFQSRCSICHSPMAGQNRVGPTLFDIVGSKSAAVPKYNFSPVLLALKVTWDDATLDKWLTNPRAMAPGTKMSFAGLANPQQRADVIAYLATLK